MEGDMDKLTQPERYLFRLRCLQKLFVLDNDALVPVGAVEVLDLDTNKHTMIVEVPEGLLEIES